MRGKHEMSHTGSVWDSLQAILSRPLERFDLWVLRKETRILERAWHYKLFESKKRVDKLCAWVVERWLLDEMI